MNHFVNCLAFGVAAWLFLVGIYGIVTSRHIVHLCLCLVVVQSSTYVLLCAVGYRPGAVAPIFSDISDATPAVDPVIQALMLTDIVVEATVVALSARDRGADPETHRNH